MTDNPPQTGFKTALYVLLAALAAIGLIIATSALWFNQYIFNNTNFTSLATQSLTSSSSRNAIATEITDKLFENRPLLAGQANELSVKVISGILDSSLASTIVERSVSRLQVAITSQYPESIEFDLTSVKDVITTVSAVTTRLTGATEEESRVDPSAVPDKIVFLEADRIPNVYLMGITLTWLGPVAFITALILLAIPLFQTRNNPTNLTKALGIEGGVVLVGGLICLLLGPLFKPMVQAQIQSANIRVVGSNLYVIAILLLLGALGIKYYVKKVRS
jgi:hypothetical protein